MMNSKTRIEVMAEDLGEVVDNCADWSLILETVFPGMYATRKFLPNANSPPWVA
jgi:hypothetical protein